MQRTTALAGAAGITLALLAPAALAVPSATTARAGVAAPAATLAGPPGTGWTLVLSDEFNDSAVDTTKWNYRTDVRYSSGQKASNVSESGGNMVVTVKHEADRGRDFTAGGLITKRPLRYGYYETRVRTTASPGWHSAFWNKYGPDGTTAFDPAAKTEIDGFEIDSIQPGNIRHNIIKWNGTSYTIHDTSNVYPIGFDTSAAFHTYGFEWSETKVDYYVDGVLKETQAYTPGQYTHDYAHLWLSVVALGTPDPAQLPANVYFDYFRYWQKDYYVDNDGPAAYGYSETGTWADSTLSGWTVGSPTRYTLPYQTPGHTATWRPDLGAAGTYQVYAYKIVNGPGYGDSNGRYDVVHNGATSTTYVDSNTGSSGWVSLGSYYFPAGTGGFVRFTDSGSGFGRADAVKFVRVA